MTEKTTWAVGDRVRVAFDYWRFPGRAGTIVHLCVAPFEDHVRVTLDFVKNERVQKTNLMFAKANLGPTV